jgi:hypothetical protein
MKDFANLHVRAFSAFQNPFPFIFPRTTSSPMHFLILFRLNKLAFHDHITGMRPRQAHKISLCDDENLRATDLIALSAKYAEDPAIFNKFSYSELGEGWLMLSLEGRIARVHTFASLDDSLRLTVA